MTQGQGHILIVDDEPAVIYTLRAILERVGYTISEASTPEQAEAVMAGGGVDVILCDLGLADGQSGLSLLERVLQMYPDAGRILLTGYAAPETIEEIEAKGIAVFMKPVEMGRLLPELRRIIEQKAA